MPSGSRYSSLHLLGDDVHDVALMSDGVEPLALHFASRTAHGPFFRSVFAPLNASAAIGEAADLSTALSAMRRAIVSTGS